MKNIAELLPEGLTEATLDAIAALVDETINKQVDKMRRTDEAKISSFLRLKIDQIKEHALTELSLENDTFRNATLFEEVRGMMSLEINTKDSETSTSEIVSENRELMEELEVLSEEFSKLLTENETLHNNEDALLERLSNGEDKLEEAKSRNDELLTEAQESSPEPFHSSEQAKVITENVDRGTEVAPVINNEFLTEGVMSLMDITD